jgi:hypothetical protein
MDTQMCITSKNSLRIFWYVERLKEHIRDDFLLFQRLMLNNGEVIDDGLVNKMNEIDDLSQDEEEKLQEAVG